MDFDYSDRCKEMITLVDRFMEDHIIPRIGEYRALRAEGVFPIPFIEDLKALAKEEGLWNLFLKGLRDHEPGMGLSNLDYAPLAELMGRVPWASEVFNCSAPDTGNMELLHMFASPDQYDTYLRPLLNGEIRSAFAMTEPDVASSDATNIQTSIRRDGDDYVINGRKWFISGAAHPNCTFMIVMGKTNPDADTYRQQSMVLVPIDTPGVTVERNITVLNHKSGHGHCEVLLRDVRVPVSNLLGNEGDGFMMAQARLGPGRIHHCMRSIGQMELSLGLMCERSLERKAFGKLLRDHGSISENIAISRMEIDQARLLVLKAASLIDEGGAQNARKEISMIKVAVAQAHCRVADRAIQVFGAMGISPDTPLADIYTQGRVLRFADGPDEVHLRRIGRMETKEKAESLGQYARFLTPPMRS